MNNFLTAPYPPDYDFYFCRKEERAELIHFLDTYWRKGHILTRSVDLLNWQHYNPNKRRYNFILARHKPSQELHGILGFIPSSQFDSQIARQVVYSCIWKTRKDIQTPSLGKALYRYLYEHVAADLLATLGISKVALDIYKHWHFITGTFDHFYLFNPQHPAVLSSQCISHFVETTSNVSLQQLTQTDFEQLSPQDSLFNNPYKSKIYYINRFYKHPIYTYTFLGVKQDGQLKAILVTRVCQALNSRCCRIVDILGTLPAMASVLQHYLQINAYEYMDLLCAGVPAPILQTAGFINKKDNIHTVIPDYFEPFEKQNIVLDFAYFPLLPISTPQFFKADADQDRPNLLPGNNEL